MHQLTRDSIRIVHVEDDNDFAELSARALRQAGFSQPIVRCNDGQLAIDYFSMIDSRSAPHVILLDLHMPRRNGLEVLHWVRQNYSDQDVAVYLLTSSEDPAHKMQATADRVTAYLIKHALIDKLIEELDCLIAIGNKRCLEQTDAKQNSTVNVPAVELANSSQEIVCGDSGGE